MMSLQVVEILSRVSTCERASIDECYLDITAEALRRLEACAGTPALPANVHEVHVCGQVHRIELNAPPTWTVLSHMLNLGYMCYLSQAAVRWHFPTDDK